MKSSTYLFLLVISVCSSSCADDEVPGGNSVPVGEAQNVRIFDIDNQDNASDIRIFFNGLSDPSAVQEYRLILVDVDNSNSFDLESANDLTSDSYHRVSSGSGQIKASLPADQLTGSGSNLANGNSYVAFVLAVSNESGFSNSLSRASDTLELKDIELFDLYVSNRTANAVELFDGVTFEHIKRFVSSGSGGLNFTQEVRFGLDGNLYVSGINNTTIKKYDGQSGEFLGDFTSGYTLDRPTKMNYGPDGRLYVSQWGTVQNAVVRFDTATGEFIDEIISSLNQGMDQAWDSQGNLYVTSFELRLVNKYDANGNFLQTLVNTNLAGPVNLWIDSQDLFVVDWSAGNVKSFSLADGQFQSVFIEGFTNVEGFLFDNQGGLFLSDWSEGTVSRFDDTTGTLLNRVVREGILQNPNSISFGPNQRPL